MAMQRVLVPMGCLMMIMMMVAGDLTAQADQRLSFYTGSLDCEGTGTKANEKWQSLITAPLDLPEARRTWPTAGWPGSSFLSLFKLWGNLVGTED